MPKSSGRALLVVLALLLPVAGLAQGLGDAAAHERQKRKSKPAGEAPPRVITNDDLPKHEPAKTSSSSAASSGSAGSEMSADEKSRHQQEKEGSSPSPESPVVQAQANADAAKAAVVAAEERVKELQDKLNPMSPSFIYGGTQTGNAVGEEMRTREELQQAQGELEAARTSLVQANQALENAREAARRSPPE